MKGKKLILFLTVFLVGLLLAVSPVIASDGGVISVSGEATITVAPDQCIIVLAVETTNIDVSTALAENAEAMSAVVAALKNIGLREDQIGTGHFSVGPDFMWHVVDRVQPPGYRVHNSITVTLDDLEMVGQVIDTAIAAGANQVQSVQFDLRDREAAMLQALQAAIAQARVKGEAMARTVGVEITGIILVREEWSSFSPAWGLFRAEGMFLDAAMPLAAETALMPSDVNIFANVRVEFSF